MRPPAEASDAATRPPVLAIYATALAPYELHLYRRFAQELPIELFVAYARNDASRQWRFDAVDGLTLEDFSAGDRDENMGSLAAQRREWRRAGRVIKRLRDLPPAAILIAGYNDLGRLRLAWWGKRRGVPVFIRSDSNLADEAGKSRLKLAIKRAYIGLVCRLIRLALPCGPTGQDYWAAYGQERDKIVMVPLEPDYSLVESITPADAQEAAVRFGLDPHRRRLVFSGRLTSVKRVDLLIDAFVSIADDRPKWDVLILGDGELRAALEARVPQRLKGRFTWAGFLADQGDVARLYHASDVLVLPSDYEPWALVVNEAAAAGLAIVTSDIVGANAALVRSGRNGENFRRGDLTGLTEALRQVTAPKSIDQYKQASPAVLAEWRSEHDPVDGLRAALEITRVLPCHPKKR